MLPRHSLAAALLALAGAVPTLAQAALYVTVVQGLGGQAQYDAEFAASVAKIDAASKTLTDADKVTSFAGDKATRAVILKHFDALAKKMTANDRAAVYLVGHGSFDGDTYKFNIAGPDLTAQDLKGVMEKLPGQNHVLVSTGSASGALVEAITGAANTRTGRSATDAPGSTTRETAAATKVPGGKYLLISGTRNGNERNATQFGRFFAEALASRDADLNKNNTVSLQEAFDYADKRVNAYFQDEGKLSTEHAQLRGDGAAQITLARLNAAEQKAELASASGKIAELLKRKQQLEGEIEELQLRRAQMSNTDYLAKFQQLVLQSAEIGEQIEAAQKSEVAPKPPIEFAPPAVPASPRVDANATQPQNDPSPRGTRVP